MTQTTKTTSKPIDTNSKEFNKALLTIFEGAGRFIRNITRTREGRILVGALTIATAVVVINEVTKERE